MEICFGFLVVSIPTYRPIYRKIMDGLARTVDARSRKHYQLEAESYESNKSAPHTCQVSAQQIFSPAQLGIVVTDDVELVRYVQHNGDWIRVAELES